MKTAEMVLMKWVDSDSKVESVRARVEILSNALAGFEDNLGHTAVFKEMTDKIQAEFEGLIDGLEIMFEELRQKRKAQEPEGVKV